MNLENDQLKKIVSVFKDISCNESVDIEQVEIELSRYLLNTFHVEEYFFFIFYLPDQKIEFCSPGVKNVLGIKPKEWGLAYAMENIHPEDLSRFIENEDAAAKVFSRISPEKQKSYKVRYDYRIKNKKGDYRRILHQVITMQNDEDGSIVRTFCVYTDISDLKAGGSINLSVIGLNGEPSFYDVQPDGTYSLADSLLSSREMDVVQLLARGFASIEIAEKLKISPNTVNNHRRKIIEKFGVHSTNDIIQLGLEQGWL